MTDEGAFVKLFASEVRGMTRDFFAENTAVLLAFADGRMFPNAEDWAKARERVAQASDEQLSAAAIAIAEEDAKRCPECRRPYE